MDTEADPRPLLAIGFGWYFRERVLSRLLAPGVPLVDVRVVTSLRDGQSEYDRLVRPVFLARGLDPPVYVEDVNAAIKTTMTSGYHPAAAVNTPSGMHFQQARQCVARGLDVYVERPVATPDDDLPALVREAEDAGVALFTGVQRRTEAPFRYLHEAVVRRQEFGDVASVRCALFVGERPVGWRRNRLLAGGGMVLDAGNHLLDCVSWILTDTGDAFEPGSARYVAFRGADGVSPDGVESGAFGHLRSRRAVDLYFDFSYAVPVRSVYEYLEFRDVAGARIRLVRDEVERTALPGLVTHQRPDGSMVTAEFDGAPVSMNGARLARTSNVAGPFESFLRARDNPRMWLTHPCNARNCVQTWFLTKEIYRHVP